MADFLDAVLDRNPTTQETTTTTNVAEDNQPAGMAVEQIESELVGETIPTPTKAEPAAAEEPKIDYNKYLEGISGNLFKDEDSFKAALPKFQKFETIAKEKEAIEAKYAEMQTKYAEVEPANDFVKTLNTLAKAGAAPEQIKQFFKINELGDLKELTPHKAMVANLVLNEGYSEAVAERKVNKEFPVSDYEEGTEEREDMEEELKVKSKSAYEALAKFKSDISKVNNSAQEEISLQQEAAVLKHKATVTELVPAIAKQMTGLGEIELKINDEPTKLKLDYPEEYQQEVQANLTQYFMDGNTPINAETVAEAERYVRAAFLEKNLTSLLQKAAAEGAARTKELLEDKYSNKSGLPQATQNPAAGVSSSDYGNFQRKVALGIS